MEIVPPIHGLAEITPKGVQPVGTYREGQNVLGTDPVSGRVMLSSRMGIKRHSTASLGAGHVKRLASVTSDGRAVTYAPGTGTQDWGVELPTKADGTVGATDSLENIYAVDGLHSIVKHNAHRRLVWSLKVAVPGDRHTIRAIAVDDAGNLFVAISDGGDQKKGRIYRYAYDLTKKYKPTDPPELKWTIEIDAYVEMLIIRGGMLITAQNQPDRWGAQIVAYQGIYSSGPTQAWTRKVAYPQGGLALKDDGSIFFSSPPFVNVVASFTASVAATVTAGNWTDAGSLLNTSGGVFANYTFTAGDTIVLTGGTTVIPATYTIVAKNTDDQIKLGSDINGGSGNIVDSSITGTITTGGARWTDIPKTLTKTGAFSSYIFRTGDYIALTAGTGVNPLLYQIASRVSDDAITLIGDINGASGDITDNTISGSITISNRGLDPRFPLFTEKTVDWTSLDLVDFAKRIYSDFNAQNIVSADVDPVLGLAENDAVTVWEDVSGNERHYFAAPAGFLNLATAPTTPVYGKSSFNGLPCVRFRGTSDILISGTNPGTSANFAEQQRTTIPAYKGAKWARFFVVRVNANADTSVVKNQCLWSIDTISDGSGAPTPSSDDMQLWINRDSTGGTGPTTGALNGAVSWITAVTPGQPGASQAGAHPPIHGYYDLGTGLNHNNDTGVMVIAMTWDSGADPTDNLKPHCQFWINGKPIDRFVGTHAVASGPDILGMSWSDKGAALHFEGEIFRILTLRDYDGMGYGGLLTTPNRPRSVGTLGGGGTSVAAPFTDTTETEIEKISGWLMHEVGISHLAPTGAGITPTLTGYGYANYDPGNYPFAYQRHFGPPRKSTSIATRSEPYQLNSPSGLLGKLDGSKGELQWVLTSRDGPDGGVGGLGGGLAVFGERIFSMGPRAAAFVWPTSLFAADTSDARVVVDKNQKGYAGYSVAEGWSVTLAGQSTYSHPRPGVDAFGNFYLPYSQSDGGSSLKVYSSKDGVELVSIDTLDGDPQARSAIPELKSPPYRISDGVGDFKLNPVVAADFARAESVYLICARNGVDDVAVRKIKLVTTTTATGSPRSLVLVGVCAGAIKVVTSGAAVSPAGASTLTQPELSTTATYVDSFVLDRLIYFTDGRSYVKYDPLEDTSSDWKATDGGKIPARCRLACAWHGRAVLARPADGPAQWFMSAQGDAGLWNTMQVPQVATQAVAGTTSDIGDCPDIINALVPYSRDLLIFGCDSSIWVMRGDPLAFGARFDQISDTTGMAFGRAWCKDPDGVLYFFGSRGGVYRYNGQAVKSMTDERIPERLRNIDLGTFRIEMEWNERFDCMHVMVIPYTTGQAEEHFIWERGLDAWHPVVLDGPQVSCLHTLDGDSPSDRAVLLGTTRGYAMKWDATALDDDGVAIESKVKIGPLAPVGVDQRARIYNPTIVMSHEQERVNWRLFATDDPYVLGPARYAGEALPGRNSAMPGRVKACYVYLEFQQRHLLRRWALEGASIKATPAGRVLGS